MKHFLGFLGIPSQSTQMKGWFVSSIGGFLGIFSIILISQWLLDPQTAVYIIPSMGASAVLLFALPHGPVSQPWSLLVGHVVSAIVGVSAAMMITNTAVAAAVAVGLAIFAMFLTRSIHPPGGATALAAVIGSAKLQSLGYLYILVPVLLNVVVLLIIAVAVNGLFSDKPYPLYLHQLKNRDL